MSAQHAQASRNSQPGPGPGSGSGLSESRFFMWRAVFALAHADGQVTDEEKAFVENYLHYVPLSDAQKDRIRKDISEPQSVNAMLIGVSQQEDMADFFQFAQMLVRSDGSYDEQERAIVERLTAEQMNRFNKAEIAQALREGRAAAALRRSIEDDEFRKQARQAAGIGAFAGRLRGGNGEYARNSGRLFGITFRNIFATLFGKGVMSTIFGEFEREDDTNLQGVMKWMHEQAFSSPPPEIFDIWRAVFALVHADGKATPQEREYIRGMMEVFRFSPLQRKLVDADLETPPSVGDLLDTVKDGDCLRQFFAAARALLWSDYEYHDKERALMQDLRERLASRTSAFADELSWIDGPAPVMPADGQENPGDARGMKNLFREMIGFQKANRTAA